MAYAYSVDKRETKKHGTVYDVRFRVLNANGEEVQKKLCGYPTKREASRAAVEFLSTYIPPVAPSPDAEAVPFEQARDAYLRLYEKSVKQSSMYETHNIYKIYINPAFMGKDLRKLDKQFYLNWQDELYSKKRSPSYLKKIRNFLNAFLDWVEERYEIVNPLRKITAPLRRSALKEMLIWEQPDFSAFAESVDEVLWKTLFMFQFFIGSRIGETLALSESDYDDNTVHIYRTISTKATEKQDKPYYLTETKNYKNRRVPVPDVLKEQLRIFFEWKRSKNLSSDFIFCGDRPLPFTSIRRHFNDYIGMFNSSRQKENTPLIQRLRVHDLRHSYVSMLIHLGASVAVIAALIGDTIETVLKTYAHLWVSDKELAVGMINNLTNCAINVP